MSVQDRAAKVAAVVESMERDMELLCLTGVEDKLQDGVRPTLELLRNAGIKVCTFHKVHVQSKSSTIWDIRKWTGTSVIRWITQNGWQISVCNGEVASRSVQKQECIPVGCLPSTAVPSARGMVSAWGCLPDTPRGQNDRCLWKHYLAPITDGNNTRALIG